MEPKEEFYHDLKQLRVAQGIALEDISSTTRINVRFFEAFEQGDFEALPLTYVRLFLRSYCEEIGADFNEAGNNLEAYLGTPVEAHPHHFLQGEPEAREIVTHPKPPKPETHDRTPAKLRQDFVTGAAIFIFLAVLAIFARRAYQDQGAIESQEVLPALENPLPGSALQPGENPPENRAQPRNQNIGRGPRQVIPVESAQELPANLFTDDRIIENLQERVQLTPPVRLTIRARDNLVIQPISNGQPGVPFNMTVAEARIYTIRVTEELELRTTAIQSLRGDLNGVPIDFGQASGLGSLRVTPNGVYEVSAYAPR